MMPRPPFCAGARALLDAVHQVGPAGADVRAEHVRAVALVVHAAGDRRGGIGELGDVAEQVDRHAADGRQEHVQVGPRDELGEHAGRLLEQRAAQARLGGAEALGDAGQVPDRIDGDLDDRDRLPFGCTTAPSLASRPAAMACSISGRSRRARVTAMLGRMSVPSAISAPNASVTM